MVSPLFNGHRFGGINCFIEARFSIWQQTDIGGGRKNGDKTWRPVEGLEGGGQGPRRGPRTKNQMLRLKKFHKERELAEIYSLFELTIISLELLFLFCHICLANKTRMSFISCLFC